MMAKSHSDGAGATEKNRHIERVEINYRGIFQKSLAYRISHDIVYISHSEGKTAFSNGRYSDDPQRNGIPCANFAFVSNDYDEEELEAIASAKMDVDEAELVIVLDDTMVKGLEPWGHYGIRPINQKIVEGGTLLIISRRKPEELVRHLERKPFRYNIAVLPGDRSFAGLWYYRDDFTDVRALGAIARVSPSIINIETVVNYVRSKYKNKAKVEAAREAYDSVVVRDVTQNDGRIWPYQKPVLPAWQDFSEGIVVKAVERGFKMGPSGQNRNPDFKRGTSKTQRPVIRFDTCIKCTLCWYDCPDECFDPTPEGLFDVNYEYCTGCGRCAQVCPVKDCIVMVDELKFDDYGSPWEMYKKDPAGYVSFVEAKKGTEREIPSHITGKGEKLVTVNNVPFKKQGGA